MPHTVIDVNDARRHAVTIVVIVNVADNTSHRMVNQAASDGKLSVPLRSS